MASSNSKKNFLNGKNILITGASKGIGKYVAKELAILGANIVLLGQNEKRLDEIYDDIKDCLLYTSPSPRDMRRSRMPSSA